MASLVLPLSNDQHSASILRHPGPNIFKELRGPTDHMELGGPEVVFVSAPVTSRGFTIEANYITTETTGLCLVVFNNRLSLYISPR
jgi:hypothetical protein